MYEFDLSTWAGILSAMWDTAGAVLRLDPEIFITVIQMEQGWQLAVLILFLAGISDMLGQSVVLFANRVTPRRFVVSVFMSGLMLIFSIAVWAVSIWLIIKFVFVLEGRFAAVLTIVALSQAPLLFGFLSLLPYLGNFIYHAVRVWSLLALLVAVKAVASAVFWQAIVACLLGWLFVQFIIHLPIFRIKAVDAWLWRVMSGTKERLDTQLLADRLAKQRGKLLRNKGS